MMTLRYKKRGWWRAFRNIPVGWVTHSNHDRDRLEMIFHWTVEAFVLLILFTLFYLLGIEWWCYIAVIVVVHTFWWVVNGNFHSYMLGSFRFVRNAGIEKELKYIKWVAEKFDLPSVQAILIYGSFCRREFHGRSDLDLRILRVRGRGGIALFSLAIVARVRALLVGCPTDLQIVDSEGFLNKQMSARELPVDVRGGKTLKTIRVSMPIDEVYANPNIVMKPEREFEGW